MKLTSARVGLLSLALASAFPAFAASPVAGPYDDASVPRGGDELRRLEDLSDDERLARLERLQDTGTRYNAQLAQQIQELQNQLAEIRGQLEEAQYKLQQQEQRGAQQTPPAYGAQPAYGTTAPGAAAPPLGSEAALDANQPLPEIPANAGDTAMGPGFGGTVPTGSPSPAGQAPAQIQLPPGASPSQPLPAGPNELADLDKAFQLVRNKQYDAAAQAYQQFITAYPNSENTPTAHYWLGQVYFAKRDYDNAQVQFQTVAERYSTHAKTDEALLKLAYIYQSKGDKAKAASLYADIMQRYPGKPSAQLAGKRLEALKKGG